MLSQMHQTEQYREQKPVLLFSKANLALCLSFLLVSLSLPGEFVSTRESINKSLLLDRASMTAYIRFLFGNKWPG